MSAARGILAFVSVLHTFSATPPRPFRLSCLSPLTRTLLSNAFSLINYGCRFESLPEEPNLFNDLPALRSFLRPSI